MPGSKGKPLTEVVYYILLALYQPTHGYGIMKFIRNMTNDRVVLGSGTLYGAINTLLKSGWIRISDNKDDDKKCYEITDAGKESVVAEIARLKELTVHGLTIIDETGDEKDAVQSL